MKDTKWNVRESKTKKNIKTKKIWKEIEVELSWAAEETNVHEHFHLDRMCVCVDGWMDGWKFSRFYIFLFFSSFIFLNKTLPSSPFDIDMNMNRSVIITLIVIANYERRTNAEKMSPQTKKAAKIRTSRISHPCRKLKEWESLDHCLKMNMKSVCVLTLHWDNRTYCMQMFVCFKYSPWTV